MKLLVVMPSKYLGNMVIALRALSATLEHFRDDNPTLLVDENFRELMELCFKEQCSILAYPRRAVGTSGIVSRARRFLAFIFSLRSEMYDIAVDFDGTVISGRLVRLARSREKIGPGFAKRPRVYNRLVPIDRDSQHCFDDFRVMAGAVGVRVTNQSYLPVPPAADAIWANLASQLRFDGTPVACIHPCATKDYKQWDIGKFAGLADDLLAKGWQVVLIGAGKAERTRVVDMLEQMDGTPLDLHGQLSLVQLVYLFQHARLFVGNDSGPMHLAAACGITVIALFGPTELLRWQPRSAAVHIVKGPEPCSPACRPEACLHAYRCLRSLSVGQVTESIENLFPG